MLPGIGFQEMVLIAIVAIVVVGPKDLPLMLRKFGRWVNKMRSMARDFQSSFEDLARQAELDELRRELQELKRDTSRDIDSIKQAVHLDDPFAEPVAPPSAREESAAASQAAAIKDAIETEAPPAPEPAPVDASRMEVAAADPARASVVESR